MLDKVVAFVAKHAGIERSTTIRIVSLVLGFFVFLVVAPIALGIVGHLIAEYASIRVPAILEMSLGLTGISVGLFFTKRKKSKV
jgi:hypothetical protein